MSAISNRKAVDAIARLAPFENHTGSLSGRYDYNGTGRLYGYDVPTDADYYVYSYQTPIAWVKNGTATMPDEKYSVTTSKHQGLTGLGLHYAGMEV